MLVRPSRPNLCKLGPIMPPFLPLAPSPSFWASNMVTDLPARNRCRAVVRPVKPAPIMQISDCFGMGVLVRGGTVTCSCQKGVVLKLLAKIFGIIAAPYWESLAQFMGGV